MSASTSTAMQRRSQVAAAFCAFAVGAATLGFEVVAGRITSMLAGVSLYSWTGVIGSVLAGLALGSIVGGAVADRRGDAAIRRFLIVALGAAALFASISVILFTAAPIVERSTMLPRAARLVITLIVLGLTPALLFGVATPLLARLSVRQLVSSGRIVGALAALSTLGGLIGALTTGLWLIPTIGTRGAALTMAGLVVAAIVGIERRHVSLLIGLAVALGAVAVTSIAMPLACERESAYQCISIEEEETLEGRAVRVLYLDGLPHAHVALDDPLYLVHDYLVPAAEMAAYVRAAQESDAAQRPLRVLMIGGGGYSLPRYLAAAYQDAVIDVLEIDPEVTAVARAHLGLRDDPRVRIHHGDARQSIATLPREPIYDLIILDAFADVIVPYQLVTREVDAEIAARLTPDGAYIALVHDRIDGRLLPAVARTVASTFGTIDVLAAGPGVNWDRGTSRTWSVVGAASPIDRERFRRVQRMTANGPFPPLSEIMPADRRAALLARPGPAVLTDDYAPIESLAAPLFGDE